MHVRGTSDGGRPTRAPAGNRVVVPARHRGRWRGTDTPVWCRADRFPAHSPNTPHNARLLVAAALADWGRLAILDDVVYCANELVINAVQHAVPPLREGRPVTVDVAVRYRAPGEVVVEVGDGDPRLPRLPEPAPDDAEVELAVSGRGLAIVRALADDVWWTASNSGGKLVLARFDAGHPGLGDEDEVPASAPGPAAEAGLDGHPGAVGHGDGHGHGHAGWGDVHRAWRRDGWCAGQAAGATAVPAVTAPPVGLAGAPHHATPARHHHRAAGTAPPGRVAEGVPDPRVGQRAW